MAEAITINEILAELEKFSDIHATDGMSAADIADASGKGIRTVRDTIRKAMTAGRLTVTRAKRPAIDGTMRFVPLYRIANGKARAS